MRMNKKQRLHFLTIKVLITESVAAVSFWDYLFLILAHVVCYTAFDSVYRIQKVADRSIMIQGINDQCDVFAHITADVVWLLKKLRCLVNQVGSKEVTSSLPQPLEQF